MASFTISEIVKILEGNMVQQGSCKRFCDVSIDSRSLRQGSLFVAIKGVKQDGHDFIKEAIKNGAMGLVVSKRIPSVPKNMMIVLVKDTTKALGQLARAHRLKFCIPVIAITGSAGKTTTKEIAAAVLSTRYRVLKNQGSFNNHWGVPLTLLRLSAKHDVAVVEVGTNHPGEIAYLTDIVRPTIAVLTNIGASHLEGFKTVENVFFEKRSIIRGFHKRGTVVINADDPFLKTLRTGRHQKYSYAIEHKADMVAHAVMVDQNGRVSFTINKRHQAMLKTPVRENVSNALAAVCCARLLKMSFSDICRGLKKASFKKNRQQIKKMKGVIVINDSYNANPVSFQSSINTLANFPSRGKRILVCGDMLELGVHSLALHREIGKIVSQSGINCVMAFGPLMKKMAEGISNAAITAASYDDIVELNRDLGRMLMPGDVVLVKGSRGMRMERVVEFLDEKLA
jgi:UDP-N-acetylmuramoyl-tripeptide--D-alanyl-D-alanine ligase